MKKLIVLSAIAALTSGAALAENDGLGITGSVEAVCEVSILDQTLAFENVKINDTDHVTFRYRCNSSSGATMTMTSLNGGLKYGANSVNYTALISTPSHPSLFNFDLTTTGTAGEQANHPLGASSDLAASPGKNARIDITVNDTPTYAGNYTDTLTVTLAAN